MLSFSIVSAYDLQVTSVTPSIAQPKAIADDVTFTVTITNIDSNPAVGETINVTFQPEATATAQTESKIVTLFENQTETFDFTYTYSTAGIYTYNATLTNAGSNDTNSTNNQFTNSITVIRPNVEINVSTITGDIDRNTIDDIPFTIENTGDMTVNLTLNITSLEDVNGNVITAGNITIQPEDNFNLGAGATKALKLEIQTQANTKPGTYTGELNATYNDDLGNSIVKTYPITATVLNAAPVITAIDNQIVVVGATFSYNVQANDPENDTITYSLTGAPAGMEINNTGLIQWTPTVATTATITVIVTDEYNAQGTKSFTIQAKNDLPEITLANEEVQMGGGDQERGVTTSKTITVTNTGTQDLTSLTASLVKSTSSDTSISSEFEGVTTINKNTLAPGETAIVTISITVPEDQDAIEEKIGYLRVTGIGNNAIEVKDHAILNLQAISQLQIKHVNIQIDGDDDSVSEGDNLDVKEGDKVVLTVTLKNTYSDDDNIKIKNAYFKIDNNDWDINERSTKETIYENNDKELEITFYLDKNLADDTTQIVIEAYGDDEDNNFEHYDKFTFDLDVVREDDEVLIRSWSFANNPVDCSARTVDMDVRIKNTGENDQDEITLQVVSPSTELNWHKRLINLVLDSDNDLTKTFRVDLPEGLKTGEYYLDITTYYDNDKQSDQETAILNVVCTPDNTNTGSNTESNTGTNTGGTNTIVVNQPTTQPPTTTPDNIGNPSYGKPIAANDSFKSSNGYIALLIVLIILILGIIITLAVRLTKK